MPKKVYESYCAPTNPEVLKQLQVGCWHCCIPIDTKDIGKIAKEIPIEDFVFDKIVKEDLADIWKI